MKTIKTVSILSFLALALPVISLAEEKCRLKVNIQGIHKNEGSIAISLYQTEENWLGKELRSERFAAEPPAAAWSVKDLAPGEYAISVYHDKDKNGELNKGAFGRPTEPYGFSNDARGRFGPAKWEHAKFTIIEGENEVNITLK